MFKCCKKPNQKQQKCPTSIILQYKTFSNPCNTCLLVDGKETRRRRMSGRWGVLWVLERRLRSRGSRVWNTSTNLDGPERGRKSEQRIEARTVRIGLPTNQWKSQQPRRRKAPAIGNFDGPLPPPHCVIYNKQTEGEGILSNGYFWSSGRRSVTAGTRRPFICGVPGIRILSMVLLMLLLLLLQ